jgi:hypothetical protein
MTRHRLLGKKQTTRRTTLRLFCPHVQCKVVQELPSAAINHLTFTESIILVQAGNKVRTILTRWIHIQCVKKIFIYITMDFVNTKYYNQKKRVILRKGRGHQAGYVTMNGAKIVSRRPTVYYIMNNGAIRALSNANTGNIPSALKYKVLKGKAPKKPKNVGNAAALNAVKAKRVAGLVKARQVKATKGAFRALPGFGNNQSLFNNNLAKKANKKLATRAKKLAALTKARAAKKMHAKNLPGWYNTEGNLFGGNKSKAAVVAANKTAEKVNKVEGVSNTTANAAVNAAAAAAKAVTPANAGPAQATNIANAAAHGATAAVQALPVSERNNKNAVAAAAAAGASQAANAAKHGNSSSTESKNIGAAAGNAVANAKKLKMN